MTQSRSIKECPSPVNYFSTSPAIPLTIFLLTIDTPNVERRRVWEMCTISPYFFFFYFQAKVEATVNMTPSRVIHLRGIPQDTTEGEIVQLGMPFGRMTNLLLVKKKNQVRTQLSSFTKTPPTIGVHVADGGWGRAYLIGELIHTI